MAINKKSLSQLAPASEAGSADAVAQDISRIVNYLNTNRAGVSERASGLLQELSHNRDEGSGAQNRLSPQALAARLSETVERLPERQNLGSELHTNPVLAARYHAFCHDLDLLLQSFRDRLASNKPVQH